MSSMRPSEVTYSSTSESRNDELTDRPFRATVVDAMLSKYHQCDTPWKEVEELILYCESFMYALLGKFRTCYSETESQESFTDMLS